MCTRRVYAHTHTHVTYSPAERPTDRQQVRHALGHAHPSYNVVPQANEGGAGLRLRLTDSAETNQLAFVWQLGRGFAGLTLLSNPYKLSTFSLELYLL